MEKAIISIVGGKSSDKLTVQFNPQTYTLKKGNNTIVKSINTNPTSYEYLERKPSVLSMELLFDSYVYAVAKQSDVREKYELLRTQLLQVKSEKHTPPVMQFAWGTFIFVGILVSLDENYTMFSESGIPVRAKVKVSFEGNTQEELNAIPKHSPDRTKIRTVTQGETLWEIAAREYGTPAEWRAIARANSIDNPRLLYSAQTLRVPALQDGV